MSAPQLMVLDSKTPPRRTAPGHHLAVRRPVSFPPLPVRAMAASAPEQLRPSVEGTPASARTRPRTTGSFLHGQRTRFSIHPLTRRWRTARPAPDPRASAPRAAFPSRTCQSGSLRTRRSCPSRPTSRRLYTSPAWSTTACGVASFSTF